MVGTGGQDLRRASPGLPGGSGLEYWTFWITGSGSALLVFQYVRLWISTPVKVYVCQVVADPSTHTNKIFVAIGEEVKAELQYCVAAAMIPITAENFVCPAGIGKLRVAGCDVGTCDLGTRSASHGRSAGCHVRNYPRQHGLDGSGI